MWQEKVYFRNTRQEKLSGILDYPETSPQKAVLLLGPHPHLGGDTQNNVLEAIAKSMQTISAITLRFNYHGSGESEAFLPPCLSVYDYYENLEQRKTVAPFLEDSLAAWDYLLSCVPSHGLEKILIGYSLGGYLAFGVMKERPVDRVCVLVPPFSQYESVSCERKIFHLAAAHDFLPTHDFPPCLLTETMQDADHFFRGKEEAVARWVLDTISRKE